MPDSEDPFDERTLLDRIQKLQAGLISAATQDGGAIDNPTYARLRLELLNDPRLAALVPDFVRRHRDQAQFWQFIKHTLQTYQQRRQFIWDSFQPLLYEVERTKQSPGVTPVTEALEAFDINNVGAAWQKALARREVDPDGAITAARTLLETVCKHLLDDMTVTYSDGIKLPALWHLTAKELNLAPSQHTEQAFKTILGSCQAIVDTLGSLRSKIGDAHGQGRKPIRPKARHAELAVNLAGAMASFLVSTWKERSS